MIRLQSPVPRSLTKPKAYILHSTTFSKNQSKFGILCLQAPNALRLNGPIPGGVKGLVGLRTCVTLLTSRRCSIIRCSSRSSRGKGIRSRRSGNSYMGSCSSSCRETTNHSTVAVGRLPVAVVVTAHTSEAVPVAGAFAVEVVGVGRFAVAAIVAAFDGEATSTFPVPARDQDSPFL